MASKEVEVLDPTPSVEKLKKSASESVLNRRHFIAALGVAGVAAAGTELVRSGPTALAQQPKPSGYAQADVLNFLLNIKYLKATLYSFITQGADLPAATFTNLGSGGIFNPPGKIASTAYPTPQVLDLFNEMYYDELSDLVTLRSILGSAVSNRATMNLLGTGATTTTGTQTVSPVQAISILRMLEDLSASAFAGATIYLTGTNLQYATQALAVNGFHAGALRLAAIQAGAPYYSPQALTTSTAGTQTQNNVLASTIIGSTTIYNFAPTNPITVGSLLTGPGVPPDTTVTAVSPVPVYTGNLSGTTAAPNNIITNVTPLTGSNLTQLQAGMAIAGTGIPTNSIITNITGSTVTIGTVTGYATNAGVIQVPYVPITNGLLGITGTGGVGLTVSATPVPLVISGGGGSGAAGTITVQTTGTSTTPATYSILLTASGSGYTSPPTITAATGGSGLVLTPTMPALITTTTTGATFTQGFLAATNKNTSLTYVSPTSNIVPGQILSGTGIPSNGFIAVGGVNAATGTVTISSSASVTSSAAPTGFVTAGSNVITQVSSTSGILFGMPISGTGIPASPAATVVTYDPVGLTITMSANATLTTTGTSSVAPTGFLTAGSNVVTALSSLSGLVVGDTITGTGLPSGTKITSVGLVNTMVLSNNSTATTVTTAGTTSPVSAILQSGNNIVSYVYPIPNGLASGQLITDSQGNIPPGTTVTGVTASSNTITLSAPATGATTVTAVVNFTGTVVVSYETISSVSSFSGLAVGQPIAGPNIAAGTIITALSPSTNSLTISTFPSAAGGQELVGAALSILSTTTLTSVTLGKVTVVSPTLSETVTVPTLVMVTPSLGTATLSQAATTTGTQTVIWEGTDPMDVEPNDPGTITFTGVVTSGSASVTGVSSLTGLAVGLVVGGVGIPGGTTIATITAPSSITLSAAATAGAGGTTAIPLFAYLANAAALASAGPAPIAGTSPSVYGGFFDTAIGSTSSSQNPIGSTFARTFSQVLAALYGSTTPQTFQGGFFPNGVSGGINFV